MARAFDFNSAVKQQARYRQFGLCACCGESLEDLVEHAHHVVPNQSGNPNDPAHSWLDSVDNCVVICDMCHTRVHQDGKFKTGAVAPADYFQNSHGRKKSLHQTWVKQLRARSRKIWS